MQQNTIIQFNSMEEIREFAREIASALKDSMNDDSRLLTAKDAAKMLGISVPTLYRYEKRGVISSVGLKDSAKKFRLADVRWLGGTSFVKK